MAFGWVFLSIIFLVMVEGMIARLVAGYFTGAAIALIYFGLRLPALIMFGIVGGLIGCGSTFLWSVSA